MLPLPPAPPCPLGRLQILICQNLRNNLQHPNEYIRGVTLRFLCRIHEEELLEPLVPSGAAARGLVGGGGVAGKVVGVGWLAGSAGTPPPIKVHLAHPTACRSPPLPLCPAVIANLEHRHSYVRKNAVLALAAIFRLPKGELLVPDAPELVEKMLQNEQVRCGGAGLGGPGWVVHAPAGQR